MTLSTLILILTVGGYILWWIAGQIQASSNAETERRAAARLCTCGSTLFDRPFPCELHRYDLVRPAAVRFTESESAEGVDA